MRTLIAVCIAVLCLAAAPQPFITSSDKVVMLRGKVAGDTKEWLLIECHNGTEWKDNGFDPTYTRVLSDYKPMFRKLPSGQWEIMFTSEIAEKIP